MEQIILVSGSLRLRMIEFSDLDSIHKLHSMPETDQYNTLGIPKDKNETKTIIEPWVLENLSSDIRNYTFAIEKIENQEFIGLIALKVGNKKHKKAEVWYKLVPNAWGKGKATEALKRLLNFAFNDLKLHRIEAGCAIENIGSIKVLEKVGMQREGHKRKVLPLKNGWSDNYEYAILEIDARKD
jgi:ribosomal-protein-alanine N-acetyltransferase